ncbi:MAG: glycosyltransferase family 4 protein [Flavobacteriales bacterium]|nr:glycosyltransferase family 4 protein [Flavobacteriales bacterium]
MNILQICHKPPVPFQDGGCLAMDSITQGLLELNVSVKVLTISTPKHSFDAKSLPKVYIDSTAIESVYINTNLHPKDALVSLLKGVSYNVNRFYNKGFEELIISTIRDQQFDVVHLESLFVLPYLQSIRNYFKGKVVLRTHNVEHQIWKNLAGSERDPVKRKYLNVLANQLEKYELIKLKQVDGIASISATDSKLFKQKGCKIPIVNIPFGLNVQADYSTNNNGLFFLGSLDWQPNIDGINWLSKNVSKYLSQPVKIAGRNPSKKWALSSTMKLVGEVEEAKQFMCDNGVMLVPLFSGSGIRIKILEAMSWGVPVVATAKAIEGLGVEHDKQVLITDDPKQFADYSNQLLADESKAKQLSQNAYNFVKDNYDQHKLAKKLVSFYNELLSA